MFVCEDAVAWEPENGAILDSRGLARALAGDTTGALEDFRSAVEQWQEQEACDDWPCEQREAWIAALEVGENPFTPEVLAELRGE